MGTGVDTNPEGLERSAFVAELDNLATDATEGLVPFGKSGGGGLVEAAELDYTDSGDETSHLRVPNGTAALCGVHGADTDTGVAFAANTLSLAAGGSAAMTATSAVVSVARTLQGSGDGTKDLGSVTKLWRVGYLGGLALGRVVDADAYTALVSDYYVIMTGASPTLTLPSSATVGAGFGLRILFTGTSELTIAPDGADASEVTIMQRGEQREIVSSGTANWEERSHGRANRAKMATTRNDTAQTVNTADDWHGVVTPGVAGGALKGWTFKAGEVGVVDAAADGGGGTSVIFETNAAHTLAVGDTVFVNNSSTSDANYDKAHEITAVGDNTHFTVVTTFGATATGSFQRADMLIAGDDTSGFYIAETFMSGAGAGEDETFDFALYVNETLLEDSEQRVKFGAGGDYGQLDLGDFTAIVPGDQVMVALSNTSSGNNFTMRNINVRVTRADDGDGTAPID